MKKSIWDKILKVVIAVASAIIGALSANASYIFIYHLFTIKNKKRA